MNNTSVRKHLQEFDFKPLFFNEVGWDRHKQSLTVAVGSQTYALDAVAEKKGMVAFVCAPDRAGAIPLQATRRKIEHRIAQSVREHIIIYTDAKKSAQVWQWVRREKGKPVVAREVPFYANASGELLIQKLRAIKVELEEENDLTLVVQTGRVRQAFDVEAVTKKFYDRFKAEHAKFLTAIEPKTLPDADRTWYTSVMLNRLMFLYFVQRKGFLAGDENYLRNRLLTVQREHGSDKFFTFYRYFLMRLFHEGLGQPAHSPELKALIGNVPYLNGGLFAEHAVERRCREQNIEIKIEDAAFERVFAFFDDFDWHLDNRPRKAGNEINPDVLGYIFEKYINYNEAGQKENGAYYTKEDITEYISRSTILPYLLDTARDKCRVAFEDEGSVWRLLRDNPDKYIFAAMKHGMALPLPPDIEAGIADVSRRDGWNRSAPSGADAIALPTEIWREVVARRGRCADLRAKLASGAVESVNDLITLNLDIRQFVADIIAEYEGADLIQALWRAIKNVRVLDPTVGSGAFLFAALNILEPLYEQCLERMETFVGDVDRAGGAGMDTKYQAFRAELAHVNAPQHTNRAYFIFKSIIVNNLFGVDIMEEATEICKLRLFLKLVAQVEPNTGKPNMGVEPLPDVDFNIRAGNTLVGYVNEADMNRLWAATGQLPYDRDPDLADKVREYSLLLTDFRKQQLGLPTPAEVTKEQVERAARMIRDGANPNRPGNAKSNPSLNNDLWNLYKTSGKLAINVPQTTFNDTHTPLHWFVEFPEVMAAGGFDVIIGNPPYVEMKDITAYKTYGLATEACADLYAYSMERAVSVCKDEGWIGVIVPMSCFSVKGFAPLQSLYSKKTCPTYISNWSGDAHPSKLFEGVDKRLSIVVAKRHNATVARPHVSSYKKWYSSERETLFAVSPAYYPVLNLNSAAFFPSSVPKLDSQLGLNILSRLRNCRRSVDSLTSATGQHRIYYTRKVSFFLQFLDFVPYVSDADGQQRAPSELKDLTFDKQTDANLCLAALSSSLFYWFNIINSDCRNLNKREVISFPLPEALDDEAQSHINQMCALLMKDYARNSTMRIVSYAGKGNITVQYFNFRPSKPIINEIDRVLAKHYGFTDEELDFILNYDIKYRMGRGGGDEEGE